MPIKIQPRLVRLPSGLIGSLAEFLVFDLAGRTRAGILFIESAGERCCSGFVQVYKSGFFVALHAEVSIRQITLFRVKVSARGPSIL
jgi:hypothetical protein